MYLQEIKTHARERRLTARKNLEKLAKEAKKDRFNRLESIM